MRIKELLFLFLVFFSINPMFSRMYTCCVPAWGYYMIDDDGVQYVYQCLAGTNEACCNWTCDDDGPVNGPFWGEP